MFSNSRNVRVESGRHKSFVFKRWGGRFIPQRFLSPSAWIWWTNNFENCAVVILTVSANNPTQIVTRVSSTTDYEKVNNISLADENCSRFVPIRSDTLSYPTHGKSTSDSTGFTHSPVCWRSRRKTDLRWKRARSLKSDYISFWTSQQLR